MRVAAALLAALSAVVLARAGAAEMPASDERFKGIPLDRCKELGGPPTWVKEGPQIVSLSVTGGRKGDPVAIAAEKLDPAGGDEVHFLWKGVDVKAPAELAGGKEFRVRVPGMGRLKGKQSGWVYLSRGAVRGKARPFQFLPDSAEPAGPPAPPGRPPAR